MFVIFYIHIQNMHSSGSAFTKFPGLSVFNFIGRTNLLVPTVSEMNKFSFVIYLQCQKVLFDWSVRTMFVFLWRNCFHRIIKNGWLKERMMIYIFWKKRDRKVEKCETKENLFVSETGGAKKFVRLMKLNTDTPKIFWKIYKYLNTENFVLIMKFY